MSGDARITGRISIDPPITWPELADKQWAVTGDWKPEPPYSADALIRVDHHDINTDQGVLSVRLGVAIAPYQGETSGYTLVQSVDRLVREFGTTPDGTNRTFTGFLHEVWGGGEAIRRVHVVDGRAVESRPVMTWPVGARDEDGAA
jgi:hypothetical protein